MPKPYGDLHSFQQMPGRDIAPLAIEVRERLAARLGLWPEAEALKALALVPAALSACHALDSETPMLWDVGFRDLMDRMVSSSDMPYAALFPPQSAPMTAFRADGHHGGVLSEAVGVAMARRLRGERRPVAAFIGTDSIHNGQTYEAMNQAGEHRLPLIVVFLDTQEAGDPNSRSVSNFVSGHLARHGVMGLKKTVKRLLGSLPSFGTDLPEIAHRAEESFIGFWTPGLLYEGFGFTYIGPLDGADGEALDSALADIADTDCPVFVHVSAPSDRERTVLRKCRLQQAKPAPPTGDWSPFVAGWLQGDSRRVVIECAPESGRLLRELDSGYSGRSHYAGTSLQYALTWAAALACESFSPLVVTPSRDMVRGYDQLVHDIAVQHLGVACLAVSGGETCPDLAVWAEALRAVPEARLAVPADDASLAGILDSTAGHHGMTLIHYSATPGAWPESHPALEPSTLHGQPQGQDITLVAYGPALAAAQAAAIRLRSKRVNAGVVNMTWIKPLDETWLEESASSPLLVVEPVTQSPGPAGLAIMERLAAAAGPPRALRCLPLEGDTVARIVEAAETLVQSAAVPEPLGRRAI